MPSRPPIVRLTSLSLVALTSLAGCPGGMMPDDGGTNDVVTPQDNGFVRPDATDPPDSTTPPMDVTQPDVMMPPPDVMMPPGDGAVPMCGPGAEVGAHVTAMSTMGWAALNRSRSLLMHGCTGAARPQDCLAAYPATSTTAFGAMWGAALPMAQFKLLHTSNYRSNYWTRSSADGRFVGHGNRIVDLSVSPPRVITTAAMYDPGFFPDNSGFMFGGTGRLCPHNVLTTGMPTNITFTEPGCVGTRIGLYEHLGAGLGGMDYWAVDTGWIADNGGSSATRRDPSTAMFGATARANLTLVANSGSGFADVGSRSISIPMQGDAVISPSSQLLITRRADGSGGMSAYALYRLEHVRMPTSFTVSIREIGNYCVSGAKPAFSFDERWLVYHHYIGGHQNPALNDQDARDLGFADAMDAGFAPYRTQGAANVYLIDLATGRRTRVTNMQPGQYALYPHFRADGWMYFIVRTAGQTPEHVVATDAAFHVP